MLPPDAAWQAIADSLRPLLAEAVPRRQAAGRVLTEALAARADVPGTDVSAMDGFAVSGMDAMPVRRPVVATVKAGDAPGLVLTPPAVARIMTGAAVPRGADRVIPVEASVLHPPTSTDEVVEVELTDTGQPGQHIRARGEIRRAGDLLLPAGTRLTAGALAVLATHGYATVPVHRLPRVAVLTTGDEVVPPDTDPAPGQLRDSNTDFLLAAGAAQGLAFHSLGIAPDRAADLSRLVAKGLEHDVLLLCGGVSMGEFDLVEGVLAGLGCRPVFDAVAIQPGKPLVFAVHQRSEGGLVFGLPGNPASVMVTYWLFVRPALQRLAGIAAGFWHGALAAILDAPLPAAAGRDRFLPVVTAVRDGELHVTPFGPKGSHDLDAYGCANGLVRVRAGAGPTAAGERAEVLPIG